VPEGSSSNLQPSGLIVEKNNTATLSSEIYCLRVCPTVSSFVEYVSSPRDTVCQGTIALIYTNILHKTVYTLLLDPLTPLIICSLCLITAKYALCHVLSYLIRDDRVWIETCCNAACYITNIYGRTLFIFSLRVVNSLSTVQGANS
jgi:hypothetical protein